MNQTTEDRLAEIEVKRQRRLYAFPGVDKDIEWLIEQVKRLRGILNDDIESMATQEQEVERQREALQRIFAVAKMEVTAHKAIGNDDASERDDLPSNPEIRAAFLEFEASDAFDDRPEYAFESGYRNGQRGVIGLRERIKRAVSELKANTPSPEIARDVIGILEGRW